MNEAETPWARPRAAPAGEPAWSGLRGRRRGRGPVPWRRLLWGLLLPERGRSQFPTAAGWAVVVLSMGVGTAAYNTGNNILFITLSLVLSSLVLSGLLSWLNFARLEWRLQVGTPFRAGQEAFVAVELRNRRRIVAAHALWCDLTTELTPLQAQLSLCAAIEPGGVRRLEWIHRPARRGVERVRLAGVGSLFPFGFMRKTIAVPVEQEVRVWPERVAYRFVGGALARRAARSEEVPRAGGGADFLGLRRYQPGDSHKRIHWKASARAGQFLVRETAAESASTFALRVRAPAEVWRRPDQFELLCRLAASLAEDLFRAGRLSSVAAGGEADRPVQHIRDLESFLDRLAEFAPADGGGGEAAGRRRAAVITFEPEGERGVRACVDGQTAARA